MTSADWIKAGVEVLAAIISGVFVGLVVYLLDERRTKRDRKLSDFRIASNWSITEPRVSLRGFDLEGTNLSGYKFVGANLEEGSFRRSRMWATNFSQANLRRADFRNTKIVGAKFIKSVAILADFSHSTIISRKDPDYEYTPDFSEAILAGTKFKKARLEGCLLKDASLKGADFAGAVVLNCDFTGSELCESKWKKVKQVENCIWKDVKFEGNEENFPKDLLDTIQAQNIEPGAQK
jgi:uncharacterized protein YjbI with pentapeptide repeats